MLAHEKLDPSGPERGGDMGHIEGTLEAFNAGAAWRPSTSIIVCADTEAPLGPGSRDTMSLGTLASEILDDDGVAKKAPPAWDIMRI